MSRDPVRPGLSVGLLGLVALVVTLSTACGEGPKTPSPAAPSAAASASPVTPSAARGSLPVAVASIATTSSQPAASAASPSALAGSASEPVSPAPDACAAVPAADVAKAFGVSATSASPLGSDGDFSYCRYAGEDGSPLLSTSLTRTQAKTFDDYARGQGTEEIAGIGDAAVWTSGILLVRKGNALLSLQPAASVRLVPDATLQAVEQVARVGAAAL
ncbi:MAG: hypothetical protein ACJ761_11360 [Chloroflexota bacterium]